MSNTRNLADLLDSGGDIKSSALDNVPATDISGKLNLTGGTLTGTLTMESTDAGNSAAPELILYRNSASPANGDYLGQVQFKGENANGAQEIYAKVTGKISDPTHNSEDGLIETAIKGDGSFTIVSRQKSDELQLLNGVNLNVDGNIVVGGTVDGVDIQTLNTTAGAALPKAGGTMTNNLTLADSVRLNVGTSADLKIHHTSGNSFIEDSGTGQLFIKASAIDFQNAGGTESLAQMVVDGAVNLFYNGTKKLETTSAGITAQGRLEIQTPNDGNTHLVQRMGSTAGSYGYVDLELVSPNSTAAGLPRLDLQIGNTTVASFLRGGGMTVTGTTRMNGPGQTGGPASSGTTQVNTVAEFSGAGNGRLYVGTDTSSNRMWFQNSNPGSLDIGYDIHFQPNGGFVKIANFSATGASAGADFNSEGKLTISANTSSSKNLIGFYNTNVNVGNIIASGSSTSYSTSSDYRLKENVEDMANATTRLKQLKPKRFNFIADDTNTLVDGFIAHEVSTIVPEAISGTKDEVDDDGNAIHQGIDQAKLVPLLVKTIQELEARITTLEA